MKKTWVKRENIYYKPFYKQKSKMLLLSIFLLGIIFFAYQVFSINKLPNVSTPWSLERHTRLERKRLGPDDGGGSPELITREVELKIIRGIRLFDFDAYKPNLRGLFRCLDGSVEIPFHHVNDDYCDCPNDGSDEPSSNACPNGRFYCKYQKRHITGRGHDVYVPSSRVNDGICDCCDGSDEWLTTECPNKCT